MLHACYSCWRLGNIKYSYSNRENIPEKKKQVPFPSNGVVPISNQWFPFIDLTGRGPGPAWLNRFGSFGSKEVRFSQK